MKYFKFLILLLPLLFLSGCYNYRELNELAITSAIGIDKTDNGYRATVQIINTQKNGSDSNTSTEQPKFVTYSYEDKNIQEALRKIILVSSKRIYASHIQILVIGQELAEEGIYNILDIFFRNSEPRKQFNVVIAKDCTAEEILNVVTPLETLNSKHIEQGLSVDNRYLGLGELVDFESVVDSYLDEHKEIILPSVELKEKKKEGDTIDNIENTNPEQDIIEGTLAVFKDDKLLGFLTEDESIDLTFIRNKMNNTVLSYECEPNKYAVSEIINTKTKLSMETDPLTAKIVVKGNLNLNEVTCDLNLDDINEVTKIEKRFSEELKSRIEKTIYSIISTYNTDVFGFRDALYKSNPKYYKQISDDWYDTIFKNLKIDVDVQFKFVEKGNALKVISR